MASDIATFFGPDSARKVIFNVRPDVRNPMEPCYIADHDAGGALLEWRIPGYPAETVFVPWANIIAIYPS